MSRGESTALCPQCDREFTAWGQWYGDGWNEPREWIADDEDQLCPRCADGRNFTITFKVVGGEDFSKLADKEWVDWFDSYDDVYIKSVEIKSDD